MLHIPLRLLAGAAFVSAFLLFFPAVALAHERRQVGKYDVIVGWSVEPAYVGLKNGIDLRVEDRDTKQLVTGIEKALQAEVIVGSQRRAVPLEPIFNTPGRYIGHLVPMAEGHYRFRFFGIVEGQQIDETFDSADGRFASVDSLEAIQFPATASSSQADQMMAQAAEQKLLAAQEAAATSQTMSIAALVVGGLGLLLGIVSMAASGRRSQA